MRKAYKYRIYPTKKQQRLLHEQLALCAELYNAALQERRDAYRMCGKSITYPQQAAQLPAIKALRPEYEAIYSQVLQDVLRRVDKAFKAFFHRVTAGLTPGYPRYKPRYRYGSLTYPQSGFGIDEQDKLSLAKIGHLKLVQHRPFKGVVKTCTITRSATGKWYTSFSCDEVEPEVLPPSERQVGIDVGLKTFVHQESRRIVNRFGLSAVEALVVRNMVKRPMPKRDEATERYLPNGASSKAGLNTSIADAAWSAFFAALLSKVK
jgi:putative transposase